MQQKIKSDEVKTVYVDLLDGLGYYCTRPCKAPFICLDNSLREDDNEAHQDVYKVLLDYHRSIAPDSIFRDFLIVKYYEDLKPKVVSHEADVFIVGRAIRHRDFTYYEFCYPAPKAHIIG